MDIIGIPLVDVYGYESDAYEAALQSPEHAPAYALEYVTPADDDLEPTEAHASPTLVSPAPTSPDYSANSELIEDNPQEAKEDPEGGASKEEEEELPALAASTLAIADPTSPSEETEPFEVDEVAPTPPFTISFLSITPFITRLNSIGHGSGSFSDPLPYILLIQHRGMTCCTKFSITITIPHNTLDLPIVRDRGELAAIAARQPGSTLDPSYQRQDDGEYVDQDHRRVRDLEKMAPNKKNMSAAAIEELITERVADALEDYKANRNSGNGNDNGNGSHDSGSDGGRTQHTACVYTYKKFLNC
ncbi:hypothetical protein Tco_0688880 [Tanacetum coccineum]